MICIALPEILHRGSFTSATNRKNISNDIGRIRPSDVSSRTRHASGRETRCSRVPVDYRFTWGLKVAFAKAAQFTNGKPDDEAVHKTCFSCHESGKDRDFVFTRYRP
jgi:hypothetical protein